MRFLFLVSAIFIQLFASDIVGIGYGESVPEAKKEALGELSQVIKSEVRTEYKSLSTDTATHSKMMTKISSNLPILGVEFHVLKEGRESEVEAHLNKNISKPLYLEKLSLLTSKINSNFKEISKIVSQEQKLAIYEKIYSLFTEYERYRSVATILGIKDKHSFLIKKAQVSSAIMKFNSRIDSLDMAIHILAKEFKESSIYVYPPHAIHNSTIAEFGSVMASKLQGKLKIEKKLKNAKYILIGEYIPKKDFILLNMQLLQSKSKKVQSSKTIKINQTAYKNIEIQPKGVDFNTLLNSGIALSNNLRVSLSSNKGDENLLFTKSEEVELFVKLNKMGYIYIVGYTQTSGGKFSYLLELGEGDRQSKFIKFVNADDASRWISLGSFEVTAPFGIESLQVIASNQKIRRLPKVEYSEDTGYYIISKDMKKALEHTRGLRPKKTKKVEYSEDVISFTTLPTTSH